MKATLLLSLLLTACGNPAPLTPQAGQSLPPPLPLETARPTAAELIEPGPQARPDRTDEILTRSEVREPDRFDLPPD